jgi:threonylcarbamoyladenosine tRNA methylthiotransferase MtaB
VRVQLQALGCRLNEAELESWAVDFQKRGFRVVGDDDPADLVVVNTCAVTADAVRKSRKLLRRSQRTNPRAKLVVSGCFATLEEASLSRETGVDLIVPNQNKDHLVEIVATELDLPAMPAAAIDGDTNPLFARGRQRAFVKVQDGCRYRCTFCIVTLARGEERSRPVAEVIDEINRLAAEGIQEVVLTGVHLGGWGSDLGQRLDELFRAVLADTDIPRVRMGSLEPWELPPDLWKLFESPRLMPHLHLPLQSGADSVLRRMARRCRKQEYAHVVSAAREQIRDFNLTTDIIVGFPGESDAEWRETMDYVEGTGFGHIHIFSYSPRAGTKAASLPGQIQAEVKRQRSREMHELAALLKQANLERYVGRRLPVLVEGRYGGERNGDWFGYTPNYLPIRLTSATEGDLVNRILDVDLEAVHADGESLVARTRDPSACS